MLLNSERPPAYNPIHIFAAARRSLVTDSIPADRFYTRDHLWVRAEASLVRVGLTEVAQDALGTVLLVELAELGREQNAGDPFGSIESSKAVTDLRQPFPGTVVQANVALAEAPQAINRDPYGAGWICLIAPRGEIEESVLLDSSGYSALLGISG